VLANTTSPMHISNLFSSLSPFYPLPSLHCSGIRSSYLERSAHAEDTVVGLLGRQTLESELHLGALLGNQVVGAVYQRSLSENVCDFVFLIPIPFPNQSSLVWFSQSMYSQRSISFQLMPNLRKRMSQHTADPICGNRHCPGTTRKAASSSAAARGA
jgi:hypothetical protein